MKLKLIACKALTRELSYLSAKSEHNIDITYMRQGYHQSPEVMRKALQKEIDDIEGGEDCHTNENGYNPSRISMHVKEDFDAILIGYGICSNGTLGLHSSKYKIVIPKCHDCISLFLGSNEKYKEYFEKYNGCFWYTASWIESSNMPSEKCNQRELEYYNEMGFDEETIKYLLEEYHSWEKGYKYAGYINMPIYDNEKFRQFTKDAAKHLGWEYVEIDGELTYLEKLLSGDWTEEDFIIIEPGEVVTDFTNIEI